MGDVASKTGGVVIQKGGIFRLNLIGEEHFSSAPGRNEGHLAF